MVTKVIAVSNRKGGTGKTTTAVALAHGLARKLIGTDGQVNGAVLLVDLDPQGNSATSLGIKPNGICISDLLGGRATMRDVMLRTDRSDEGGPSRPNLFLIPSSDRLAKEKARLIAGNAVAGVLQQMGHDEENIPMDQLLVRRLAPAMELFRFIILDCPPTLDVLEQAVYRFADTAVVPVRVDFLSTTGAAQHTKGILEAQAAGLKITIEAIVPTFVRQREVLARDMIKAMQNTYGKKRVSASIPSSVKVKEAPAADGQTVFEYAPGSAPAKAYQKLVDKVFTS